MTSAIAPDSLRLVQEVAPVLRHRKVVLFGRFAPAWRPEVEALRAMGARPPLVVTARGTGDPLPAGAAEVFHTELTAPDAVAGFRTWEALAANPPPAVRAAVERFDPAGEAIAILDASASRERLLGRLVFGARPPAWVRWEDKLEVDRIWDACGVPRPPSAVVPLADASALSHYSNRLDAGDGVVWAGDASQGFNAGAALTRPVFSGVDVAGARAFFEGRCAAVRITPFLRGIPCRVHGFVLPSGVCGGSPVE
ncbi:MAG TPA: hypothetical protein VEA99_05930, partial [Gemmatimonadaceae bacterium]|nr:hypothetical protein [Gemmatimonadaceae bacterium]